MADEPKENGAAGAGTGRPTETPPVERDSHGRVRGGKSGKPRRSRKRTLRGKSRKQIFVENAVSGMTSKEAALGAGFAPSTAEHTKEKLWSQPDVQAHFQRLVQGVLPPERATALYDALLEGKSVTTQMKQERVMQKDGTTGLQVVSATRTETVDRSVQLRALQMAAEHGGLVPSSIRAQTISPASLEDVLLRAEQEYEKHAAMMTPTWLKERAKRLGNGHQPPPAAAEKPPEPARAPVNPCDACGKERCAHGRCLACETCEPCETPAPIQAGA
jgi:hypothetical protein